MTIEEILTLEEGQIFDRKSIFIKPADLSDTLCAFANAVHQKRPIDEAKVADLDKNLPINTAKVADLDKNLPIDMTKVADLNEMENNGNISAPMKISIEVLSQAYQDKGYNEPTVRNLMAIYEQMEARQVFNSAYLMKLLKCSERTARGLLAKLRDMNVVISVTGRGKGMYRFKDAGE